MDLSMINYNSAISLKSFLDQNGLGMQKKFGQNFLINPQIRYTLVEALGVKPQDEVWEIGPGLGAMTALLLEKQTKVKAFEIDIGFNRILKQLFCAEQGFFLVEGDVLKTWPKHEAAPYLIGNLPYNIAAVLLANLIENKKIFSRMVVTVQKEVALRMAALPGTPDYSSFSVLCASAYKVKPLMSIGRSSFYPAPNVDSMGVLFEKRENCVYPDLFYKLVRSLFASRRKTVKNNLLVFLSSAYGLGKEDANRYCSQVLNDNYLPGNKRAENLELETFASIAKTIKNMQL